MAHCVEGYLAEGSLLERTGGFSARSVRVPLRRGFVLMIEPGGPEADLDATLPPEREAFGRRASAAGAVAFVSTRYWGGPGEQGAAAWSDGRTIVPWHVADRIGPINAALAAIGVRCDPDRSDAFDTVGLGVYRSHDDWIAYARDGKAHWERAPSRWLAE